MFDNASSFSIAAPEPARGRHKKIEAPQEKDKKCLAGCGNSFIPTFRRTRYCSVKCSNHAALIRWRAKQKVLFFPKNCEMCGDEFAPTRTWQRFCHRDCMVLYQNNYGRLRHQIKNEVSEIENWENEGGSLIAVRAAKVERTVLIEKEENVVAEKRRTKKCSGFDCLAMCKVIRRIYTNKPSRVVSFQEGWSYDQEADLLLCKICQLKIAVASDSNFKLERPKNKKYV
jgi:hypothetical protein